MSDPWLYPTGQRLEQLRAPRCGTCGHLLAEHEQEGITERGRYLGVYLVDGEPVQTWDTRHRIVTRCNSCTSDPRGCPILGLDRRGNLVLHATPARPQLRLVPR